LFIYCFFMIISFKYTFYFLIYIFNAGLKIGIVLIHIIFVCFLIKVSFYLFLLKSWHFNDNLVRAYRFVSLLLLIHLLLFVDATEIVTIAAIGLFLDVLIISEYFFTESLLLPSKFNRIFLGLLFINIYLCKRTTPIDTFIFIILIYLRSFLVNPIIAFFLFICY
jgi:hypothetical protein